MKFYETKRLLLISSPKLGESFFKPSSFLQKEKACKFSLRLKDKKEEIGFLEVIPSSFGSKIVFSFLKEDPKKGYKEEALTRLLFILFLEYDDSYVFLKTNKNDVDFVSFLNKQGFYEERKYPLLEKDSIYCLKKETFLSSYEEKISYSFLDEEYPLRKEGFKEKPRIVARGIIMNEEGKIALHQISRDDIFGKDTYLETPGGGIHQGETLEEALIREGREELGMDLTPYAYLGYVEDEYRLIGQKNISHFFFAKGKKSSLPHFVSKGDSLIEKTCWFSPLLAYQKMKENGEKRVPASL